MPHELSSEHPLVVLLILRGFHLCQFSGAKASKEAAFRIKRQQADRESQLQFSVGSNSPRHKAEAGWVLKDSSLVRSYRIIPWDDLLPEAVNTLTLRDVEWITHNITVDESVAGPH